VNEKLWELDSVGATAPFSLDYVAGNLGHALQYFFTLDGYQPNAPLLALLGLLALPVFLLWAQRIWRGPRQASGAELGLALGALGPMGITVLIMLYFWGQFDHPVIQRLSLPTQLLFLVATSVVVGRVARCGRRGWNVLLGLGGLALVAYGIPVMAKNAYGREYSPGLAYQFRGDFLSRQSGRNFLMIDRDSLFWITHRIAATPVAQAQDRREGIAYHLRNHSFSGVYVFQTYSSNPETGELTLDKEDVLDPSFVLEPVEQRRVQILRLVRISRVVEIRDGEKVLARQGWAEPLPEPKRTVKEREDAKRAYLDRWVRELP
jgi:hypothetical protein